MTEIEEITDEFQRIHNGDAWHGASLGDILAGITAEQAAAKPIAAAHSIWELVLHIAAWEDVFLRRLDGHPIDEPEEGDFPPMPDPSEPTWEKMIARLNDTHRLFIERLSRMSTEQLDEKVIGKDYTVRFMLRGIIRHHVYHAGQIGLLKKA